MRQAVEDVVEIIRHEAAQLSGSVM
jgi:hypothetical protein